VPLVPGVNCTVRLTGGKIVATCQKCGVPKRTPFTKEREK
jgi:ribonuclease P protein subunit RPR2